MKTAARKSLALFVVPGLIFLSSNLLGADRIAIPDGIYYHRFASSISGPEASWANPAGLGYSKKIEVQYLAEFREGELTKDWGLNITGDGLGISYRHLNDFKGGEYNEYIFSMGAQFGHGLFWGCSYRYIKNGAGIYNRRHSWNLGFLLMRSPRVSYGMLFSNLNRGRINGKRTDIEQLYSISYSLFDNTMLFSTEITLSTGQSLSGAEYNYGVDLFPMKGVMLYGNLQNHKGFEIGLRINLAKYFVGGQSRFDDNNAHCGTSLFAGFVSGDQPSVIPPGKKGRY